MVRKKNINQGLHFIRGACAVGVAAYHYISWTFGYALESIGAFYVYIFFIVSAVAMMMAHASDFADAITTRVLRVFYLKRVARIMPLLALVALVTAIEGSLRSGSWQIDTFAKAYLTASTLFGLHMPGMMSGAVAAWSLGVEALFYVVFPVAALMVGGGGARLLEQ